jgi:hypothetical protein
MFTETYNEARSWRQRLNSDCPILIDLEYRLSPGKILKMKFVLLVFFCCPTFAHEGHQHGAHTQEAKEQDAIPNLKAIYADIQSDYQKTVKPVFDTKCGACHSAEVMAPWYTAIPGFGWIVESERAEAKEHLEFSKGFPFAGHGTPEEDLEAIRNSIVKDAMPTRLYRFIHPSHRITDDEKLIIFNWIESSQKRLLIGKNLAH